MTQEFEERLKPIREKAGLTQQEVADYLGISRNAYANLESLRSKMRADLAPKFCEVCGISLYRFFTYSEITNEEYAENMDVSHSIANFVNQDIINRNFVLWLSGQKNIKFQAVVLMSVAYCCMPPVQRDHISACVWYTFEYCYHNFNYELPEISDKVYELKDKFRELRNQIE